MKIDHNRPMGKVQSLEVPGWKLDSISMDFVTVLLRGSYRASRARIVLSSARARLTFHGLGSARELV